MKDKIVVIGGTSSIVRVTLKKLVSLLGGYRVVLAARNQEKAQKIAESFMPCPMETCHVDVFDTESMKKAMRDAALVLNATWPLSKTGVPVLKACIEGGVNYIDYGDDSRTCETMLTCDDQAKRAGVAAIMCAGYSPGFLGVIMRHFMTLINAEDVLFAWRSGSGRAKELRMEHVQQLLMRTTGKCTILEDGKKVEVPAFRQSRVFPMPEPIGPYVCYAVDHAEVSTFSHFYPHLKNIQGYWGVYPPYLAGIFQGISSQVDRGKLQLEDAVDFIAAFATGKAPKTRRPYLGIVNGILRQLCRGDMARKDFSAFLKMAVTGNFPAGGHSGIVAIVRGKHRGKPAEIRYSRLEKEEDEDDITGASMATFIHLFLDNKIKGQGVLSPEICVDPGDFFDTLERLGMAGIKEGVFTPQIEYR